MKAVLNMIKMLRPVYTYITEMAKQCEKKYNSRKKVFSTFIIYLSCLQQVRYTFFQIPLTERTIRNIHLPMLFFM